MSKWVFLDIDGVLNHQEWYQSIHKKDLQYPFSEFDPACVERVNRILKETGATLVISSSWRSDQRLPSIFAEVGLPEPRWRTISLFESSKLGFKIRGQEIDHFLQINDREQWLCGKDYAIIDDDNDFDQWQKKFCLFRTAASPCDPGFKENQGTGLTEILTEKIIKHLNGKKKRNKNNS